MVKPEFFRDKKLAALSLGAERLFLAMGTICDDRWVCPGEPEYLKANLFLYRPETLAMVARFLTELVANDRVQLVLDGDDWFAHLPRMNKHHKINHPSKFRFLSHMRDQEGSFSSSPLESVQSFLEAYCDAPSPKTLDLSPNTKQESNTAPAAPAVETNPMKILGPLIREHLYIHDGQPPEGHNPNRCASIVKMLLASNRYTVDDLREAILVVPLVRAGKVTCDESFRRFFVKEGKVTMRALNDRWGSGLVLDQLLHMARKAEVRQPVRNVLPGAA